MKEIVKKINNLVAAIEDGLYTSSTKERLQQLEAERNETEILIAKEELSKPTLSKEDIIRWFNDLRNLNIESLSGRKRLIDIFINSVIVYDDKLLIVFNYRDGADTVPVEIIKCSDISISLPQEDGCKSNRIFLLYSLFATTGAVHNLNFSVWFV